MSDRHHARCLLVVRLNNFRAIERAFGKPVAAAAMEHLRRVASRFLGRAEICSTGEGEMALSACYPAMRCAPLSAMVEALCAALGREPVGHGDAAVLLSVSAGFAHDHQGGSMREARGRLAASALPDSEHDGGEAAKERYRKDMRMGVTLIRAMQRDAAFVTWRPVGHCDDRDMMLYHEATLRRLDHRGQQVDCAEAYAALERLGVAHLVDRMMLIDMLGELERDADACLSAPISAQSLSLNLHGEQCGWNEIIPRLERDRNLARRLIIEIADNVAIARLRDTVSLVRTLRALGVRFVVTRFGSGQASIEQLTTIEPDAVKLDSSFLHTAYRSDRNRKRMARIVELARTVSRTVIIDGVESPWHLRVAHEEDAEWIAGSHLGRPSRRRGREAVRSDDLAGAPFHPGLVALSVAHGVLAG